MENYFSVSSDVSSAYLDLSLKSTHLKAINSVTPGLFYTQIQKFILANLFDLSSVCITLIWSFFSDVRFLYGLRVITKYILKTEVNF